MLIKSPFCNSEFAKKHGLTAEEYAILIMKAFLVVLSVNTVDFRTFGKSGKSLSKL